ncbi:GTPase-associated protein 1-related protein, partial [Streptomyces sp. MCAF7]
SERASSPETFSYSLLSDGSGLLARTVHTGVDHSGRRGTFHGHAVYLPTGASLPGGALPITAWGSPQWATRAPEGGVPEPLEALTASGRLNRDGLVAFAGSRAPWLERFFADLRRLSEDESAPRIILVERDSADVARWIALACAALPRDFGHRLTFTTYAPRPELSRQQIIGVRPEDGREPADHGHRCRVYDVAARRTGEPVSDAWAEVAAGIWLGGAPELFKEADALPGGPFAPGALAVGALCAGLDLGTTGRTEAADWARHHPEALGDERLHRLLAALCVPDGGRSDAEKAALTGLFTCLDGRVPTAVSTPLAALVLAEAVRAPVAGPGLEALRPDALTEEVRLRLAGELAADLRVGVSDTELGIARPLELLRIADLLGVDCSDLLPKVAHGLAQALLADPEATHTPAVRLALDEHFALRTALLGELDTLAVGDPLAVGVVWAGGTPTAHEARLMLGEIGSDAHRAAGTSATLLKAALEGPAHDADVPDLGHDLLRCFAEVLTPRDRASLLLLEFARDLRSRRAEPGWAGRALSLRATAEPVEATVLEHAFGALADRVLSQDAPDGELYALIHSEDPALVAAYGRAAGSERVLDRLRAEPSYVAECFTAWSSHPQAGGAWQETRTALLDSVLRPVVRALPAADIASVEHHLERTSVRWADEFRAWSRPG